MSVRLSKGTSVRLEGANAEEIIAIKKLRIFSILSIFHSILLPNFELLFRSIFHNVII